VFEKVGYRSTMNYPGITQKNILQKVVTVWIYNLKYVKIYTERISIKPFDARFSGYKLLEIKRLTVGQVSKVTVFEFLLSQHAYCLSRKVDVIGKRKIVF